MEWACIHLGGLTELTVRDVLAASVICVKTFSTCANAEKWKKVEKSGKLVYFGKCDKIGVLHRKVEFSQPFGHMGR